jgi:hypothetical protein
MKTQLMMAAAVLVSMTACKKDENPTNATGYSLSMRAGSAPRTSAWNIVEARAVLHEIELESDDDNGGNGSEIDIEGTFNIDLLTGVSNPPLPTVTIPAGVYNELEVQIGHDDDDDDDNNTAGQVVFFLKGTGPANGSTVPFEVSVTQAFELEILDDDAGIFLPEGDIKNLTIWVDVLNAMSTLDLSSATADADGVIRISETKNSSLFFSFLALLDGELED